MVERLGSIPSLPTMTKRMQGNTKSKRQAMARRARRYGYHQSGRQVWTRCILCHREVHGDMGYSYTAVQALDYAMQDHLIDCIDKYGCNPD